MNKTLIICAILAICLGCIFYYIWTKPKNHSCQKEAFYFESFDNGMAGWSVDSDKKANWEWVSDGMAAQTPFAGIAPNWGKRKAIESCSKNGAMVFNGDGYNRDIDPDRYFTSTLTSPIIDCSKQTKVYLKFNQYFRKYKESEATIWVSNDGGVCWLNINESINTTLPSNVETSNRDVVVLDISNQAAKHQRICIRFEVKMKRYFWIIDDVSLNDCLPSCLVETKPAHLGKGLATLGYDYDIDEYGAPFVPDELVVEFDSSATFVEKQEIRNSLGVISYESCVCNKLELWKMGDNIIINGEVISPDQFTIDILENSITLANNIGTIKGVSPNYYTYNDITSNYGDIVDMSPLSELPSGISSYENNNIIVAVLDTGIDYNNSQLSPYIKRDSRFNPNPTVRPSKSDCYFNDYIGWNFVENNNNPNDNHSHGTHVAGIIVRNLKPCLTSKCTFKILPVRTHNENGVGNLFDATCGLYYALLKDAKIINASWGFPGGVVNSIIENAVDEAKDNHDALIVAAAGNESVDFETNSNLTFPACMKKDNVLSIASIDVRVGKSTNGEISSLSNFSNFSNEYVLIGTNGENIISDMPIYFNISEDEASKSGTSMATPKISASAIRYQCLNSDSSGYQALKNLIYSNTDSVSILTGKIEGGRVFAKSICRD